MILTRVVEAYIASGHPVGSKALVEAGGDRRLAVDRALRAGRARGARAARPSPHLGGPRADRRRLPAATPRSCWSSRRASCEPLPVDLSTVRSEVDTALRDDDRDAVAGDDAAGARHRAAAGDDRDPPRRGAAAAAAGRDGRGHHLHRRRDQEDLPVRGGGRSRSWPSGPARSSTSSWPACGWARGCCRTGSTSPASRRASARSWRRCGPAFTELVWERPAGLYVGGAARLLAEMRFADLDRDQRSHAGARGAG